jgi:hypothetical protein
MSFNKILSHPDKNTIVRMLTQGQGVRKVAKYLKDKYPDDRKMHISVPTLQKFRKDKLQIEGEVLDQIKQETKKKKEEKEDKKADTQLRRTPAYKEAVQKAAEMHVDIRQELSELMALIKTRIEDLFDRAADGEITVNEEANLQKYFPILGNTLNQWMKYVEKVADQTIETNINITVIEDQMALMREAIRDTFADMDPALAIKFLDNLNMKMERLHYQKQPMSFEQIHQGTQKLGKKMIDISAEDPE